MAGQDREKGHIVKEQCGNDNERPSHQQHDSQSLYPSH